MGRSVIGDLVWRVVGDTSSVNKALGSTDKSVTDTGKGLKGLETLITGAVIGSLVAMGKAAFDAGKAFDQGLGNVATLLNDPQESIAGLKESVKDLAIDTGLSLGDLTDGLYQVVSAFGDTSEASLQLEQASKAAKAGLASVADSVSLASAVTKAYGDTSAEAQQKVFDLSFQAVKLGETSFPELAASMSRVTAGSVRLGVSQEELFASFAALTGPAGNAAEVSTQLRAALVALENPTTELSKLYDELGVSSGAALIEQEGLQGALALIVEESEDSGKSLTEYVSSVEAVSAASFLGGSLTEDYTNKLEAMSDASGAATDAFNIQATTLEGTGLAFDRLTQSLEVLKTTFYDFYSEELANTFNGLTVIVEAFGDLNTASKNATDELGAVSKVLSLVNPLKAMREYNSLVFGAIGNIGKAKDEVEEVAEYTDQWVSYAAGLEGAQERITEELERQAEVASLQTAEIQKQIDLENQRVAGVIAGRAEIETAYNDEIRQIEAKNELGLLAEEEYIEKRLQAEVKLQDSLIQLGYDGVAGKGQALEQGDIEIQESIARREALEEEATANTIALLKKQRAEHKGTYEKAREDLEEYKDEVEEAEISIKSLSSAGIGALTAGFATLGEELVAGELNWDSFAKVALNAVAAVLDSLGAQLAAIAATNFAASFIPGLQASALGVGPALLGSAAAYSAAGLVRGLANSFESGGIIEGVPSVSDNVLISARSGEEVIPEEDPRHSNNIGNSELTVNLVWDAEVVAKTVVEDFVNTGRYTIAARGLR